LWDTEEIFKNNSPLAANGLCLQSVFFDVTAAQHAAQQSPSQPTQADDLSLFFGSSKTSVPFQTEERPQQAEAPSSSSLASGHQSIPPLVSVVVNLFHATQVESSNIVSVCLESLFKIALWCPLESPLRQLITEELHEISASSFGLNFPFLETSTESTVGDQLGRGGPFVDLFESPYSVDPRSVLSTLDRLGLSHVLESPFSTASVSAVDPSSLCQFSARQFGNEWHESSVCRESSLYSLALESLAVSKDPPQFSAPGLEPDPLVSEPGLQPGQSSSSDFLGMDLLGDLIAPSAPVKRAESHSLLLTGDVDEEGREGAVSSFVVDGVELKKLFYQLDQKALFQI
jgi:hypothetical protein